MCAMTPSPIPPSLPPVLAPTRLRGDGLILARSEVDAQLIQHHLGPTGLRLMAVRDRAHLDDILEREAVDIVLCHLGRLGPEPFHALAVLDQQANLRAGVVLLMQQPTDLPPASRPLRLRLEVLPPAAAAHELVAAAARVLDHAGPA